jgi:hypothetical protein
MTQTSDPIPFFGGEMRIINTTETHVYSDVCSLMFVDLIEGGLEQSIPMIFWQDTGATYCPADWQSIPSGFGPDEVSGTRWINLQTGSPAIMMDGLPRSLF